MLIQKSILINVYMHIYIFLMQASYHLDSPQKIYIFNKYAKL